MTDGLELRWPGKYDAAGDRRPPRRPAIRTQLLERHGDAAPRGHLILGENLEVLSAWCEAHAGEADLVYMDPPFMTGGRFGAVRKRGSGKDAASVKVSGYEDRWPSRGAFIAMLDDRVRLSREILAAHGSLYLHLDPTMSHAAKLLGDDIFGKENFQREIIWRIGWVSGFKSRVKNWVRNHDVILFYARDAKRLRFTRQFVPHLPGYERRSGKPTANPGIPLDDVWNASPAEAALQGAASLDSIQIKSFSREKTGWGTQKNESLVERVILASSTEGGLVVDPFMGSGTTAAVAARLGRRFLGCDRSALALQLARERLLALEIPFVIERVSDAATTPASATVTDPIARAVRCVSESKDDWRVTFAGSLGHVRVPESSGGGGRSDDEPTLEDVEAWCILDEERRVLWSATRTSRDDRGLEAETIIRGSNPKFIRSYGVMGDISEVVLKARSGSLAVAGWSYTPATLASSPETTE